MTLMLGLLFQTWSGRRLLLSACWPSLDPSVDRVGTGHVSQRNVHFVESGSGFVDSHVRGPVGLTLRVLLDFRPCRSLTMWTLCPEAQWTAVFTSPYPNSTRLKTLWLDHSPVPVLVRGLVSLYRSSRTFRRLLPPLPEEWGVSS